MVGSIMSSHRAGDVLSEGQMALYLGHYKQRLEELNAEERQEVSDTVLAYIRNDGEQGSFLHLENIVYCLFLAVSKLKLGKEVYEWLAGKIQRGGRNATVHFLGTLFPHEDKLSCLKVDLWIAIGQHGRTLPVE
jgi:hypothetical protein